MLVYHYACTAAFKVQSKHSFPFCNYFKINANWPYLYLLSKTPKVILSPDCKFLELPLDSFSPLTKVPYLEVSFSINTGNVDDWLWMQTLVKNFGYPKWSFLIYQENMRWCYAKDVSDLHHITLATSPFISEFFFKKLLESCTPWVLSYLVQPEHSKRLLPK